MDMLADFENHLLGLAGIACFWKYVLVCVVCSFAAPFFAESINARA